MRACTSEREREHLTCLAHEVGGSGPWSSDLPPPFARIGPSGGSEGLISCSIGNDVCRFEELEMDGHHVRACLVESADCTERC
jgi:hypothetical protein